MNREFTVEFQESSKNDKLVIDFQIDVGYGKSQMQIKCADLAYRITRRPVLIVTVLIVINQLVSEAQRANIDLVYSDNGEVSELTITDYEKINCFNLDDFGIIILGESAIAEKIAISPNVIVKSVRPSSMADFDLPMISNFQKDLVFWAKERMSNER